MNGNTLEKKALKLYESLTEPSGGSGPISLEGFTPQECLLFLQNLMLIRFAELKLAEQKEAGKINGPVHLAVGQEAVPVGISRYITSDDFVFGGHRSHGHLLALGCNLKFFFAEILGKKSGLCGGIGGSMHLQDLECRFFGSVPIVSGTVPIALGAALSAKMDGKGGIAVVYFGDGAVEEGVVHECFNLASSMSLPIIFVVENNLYASHMSILERQPSKLMVRFAEANHIRHDVVDGNNVTEVSKSFQKLMLLSRSDAKPGFLEAITYRRLGHVDWREDVDVGVDRDRLVLESWKKRDPIDRLSDAMIQSGSLLVDDYETRKRNTRRKVDLAWDESFLLPPANRQNHVTKVFYGT